MQNIFNVVMKTVFSALGIIGLWLVLSSGHEASAATSVSVSCTGSTIKLTGASASQTTVTLALKSIKINASTAWDSSGGCSAANTYSTVDASGVSSGQVAFSTDGSTPITFIGNGTSSSLTFTDSSSSTGDTVSLVTSPSTSTPDTAIVNGISSLNFYGIAGTITGGSGRTNSISMDRGLGETAKIDSSNITVGTEAFDNFTTIDGGGTSTNASTNTLDIPGGTVTLNPTSSAITISSATYTFSNFKTVTASSAGTLSTATTAGLTLSLDSSGVISTYSPTEAFDNFTTIDGNSGSSNTISIVNQIFQPSSTSPGSGVVTIGSTQFTIENFLNILLTGTGTSAVFQIPSTYQGSLVINADGSGLLTDTASTPNTVLEFSNYGTISGNSGIDVLLPNLASSTLDATYTNSQMSLNTTFVVNLEGFTTFTANTSGQIAFSTDGSTPITFIGNGAGSSLTLSGSGSLNLLLTPTYGSGSVGLAGQNVLSYTGIEGGYSGNQNDILTGPDVSSTFTASGTDEVQVESNSPQVTIAVVKGIMDLVGGSPNTIFMADSTPGYSFQGDTSGEIDFANATGAVTVCMTTGIVNLAGIACSAGATTDSFTGITSLVGSPFNDNFIVGPGTWSINGGAGVNTVSFQQASVSPAGLVVNLEPGVATQVSGLASGTAITSMTNISNVIGADAPTTIYEGTGSEYLGGGGGATIFYLTPYSGNTVISGGAGAMTINLSLAKGSTSLDLADTSFQPVGGGLGTVMILPDAVENIVGSVYGGLMVGGSGSGTISVMTAGSGTMDYVAAGTGNYTLDASSATGQETLAAGSGNDTLIGGSGNNFFAPGSGQLQLESNNGGTNWLDFVDAPSSVDVNLGSVATVITPPSGGAPIQVKAGITGGWLPQGVTDTISIVVNSVIGTSFSDIIVANNANDNIFASGDALIIPGQGNNNITCANGSSCTVDYQNMPIDNTNDARSGDGITLNANGTVDKWGVGGASNPAVDTLVGISTVVSTESGNDTLISNAANQTLIALNGKDLLQASAQGYDTLIGGNGQTTFEAGVPVADTQYYTGAGHDTMIGGTGTAYYFTWIVNNPEAPTAVIPNNDVIMTGDGASTLYVDPSTQVSGPSNKPLTGLNSIEQVLSGFAQNGQQLIKYPLEPETG